jgi:uncharacterized BrkB/YihY/UPF0761 family membrane protein
MLLWVFYSSQIVFYGAEFTRALAVEKGVSLNPVAIKKDRNIGIDKKHVAEKKT